MSKHEVKPVNWQHGMPSLSETGGLAVAHNRMHFLGNQKDLLFPREWLRELLSEHIIAEQGVGHLNGVSVYVFEIDQRVEAPHLQWYSMRLFMMDKQFTLFRLLAFASQVGTWVREHRFCGSCGRPMMQSLRHRMRYCEPCRVQQYPRLSPCMIVVITRGDEILLGRSPRFVPGMYSALAGYAEPNETIEGCVEREVYEEVRLKVKNIRYIGSQNWPYPHSMMFGFHAEYDSGEIVLEPEEIEDAQWFNVRDLPPLPPKNSIARYLIDLYVCERLGPGHTEPVLPS